jgi:hypothetical protein
VTTSISRSRTAALLSAVVLGFFIHQIDTATAQGEAIFAHALKTARADGYSRYAKYDVVVTFTNGTHHTDSWATTEDMTHASVYADIFSQQERIDPATPHGTNVGLAFGLQDASQRTVGSSDGKPATSDAITTGPLNAHDTSDPVGPVALAVDQNFGLTAPRPYVVVHEGETFSSRADGFTTIGTTTKDTQRYAITLIGLTGTIAHLKLTPLRDAYHNRLRELWVETDTGYVDQAIVEGVGDRQPIDHGHFKVTFVRKDGATYISTIKSIDSIHFGDDDDVSDLTFTFTNLVLTNESPKYTFGISTQVQQLKDP